MPTRRKPDKPAPPSDEMTGGDAPVQEPSAPLTPPAGQNIPDPADDAFPAPLTPPADPEPPADEVTDQDAPPDEGMDTPAAPLTPPAAPAPAPPMLPTPEPLLGHTAMPDAEFVDLVDEFNQPVDPERMFADPGPRFTYVQTTCRITRVHRQSGANITTNRQLLYPAGRRIDKGEAAKLYEELAGIRAAQAAEEQQ